MDRVAVPSTSRPYAICLAPRHYPSYIDSIIITLLGPLSGLYLAPKPSTTSLAPYRRRRHPPTEKMDKSLDFTNAPLRSIKHTMDTTMTRTPHERVTNMTYAAAITTRTSPFLFILGDIVTGTRHNRCISQYKPLYIWAWQPSH